MGSLPLVMKSLNVSAIEGPTCLGLVGVGQPDFLVDGGHANSNIIRGEVEDHLVGGHGQGAVIGGANFLQHGRQGVVVVVEVVADCQARLGHGHYLAELLR